MGIVAWTGDNITEDMFEPSEELLLAVLQMNARQMADRWKGKLEVKPGAQKQRICVTLKKNVNGTELIIRLHRNPVRTWHKEDQLVHKHQKEVNIALSGKVAMDLDDLREMNLAIEEGLQVYRYPKHWQELNAYDERRAERIRKKREAKSKTAA